MSQNYTHRVWAACTATLLSFCSVAVQAGAQDASAPQQVTVRFADLNLAVPQGAEALYARLRGAARQVCGPEDAKNLKLSMDRRACIEKATADAVTQVSNAQLRAVYEAHQGRGQATRIAAVAQR